MFGDKVLSSVCADRSSSLVHVGWCTTEMLMHASVPEEFESSFKGWNLTTQVHQVDAPETVRLHTCTGP